MNEPNKTRTIPLHIADQAVAACEAEIQKLKEENARLHSLFANSEQENARLKAEVERLTETIEKVITAADVIDERNQRLIAEVERLRKAGDEMANKLPEIADTHLSDETWLDMQSRWIAAKEGKPSV